MIISADVTAALYAENVALQDENARLRQRIADLEAQHTAQQQVPQAGPGQVNGFRQAAEQVAATMAFADSHLQVTFTCDECLATMSHELRTPLNAILGFSEALEQQIYGALNARQLVALRVISESGQHLLNLVNDILDVAAMDAGRAFLNPVFVTVESVCRAGLQSVRHDAAQKHLMLVECVDRATGYVYADECRLTQILVRLLNNAVKRTPVGGEMGLRVVHDQEHQLVLFTVWDTGGGMPAEDMPRVFTSSEQVDAGLNGQPPGSSWGLPVLVRLARLHGGSVKVESEPGRGSCFTIILPWYEYVTTHDTL